MNGDWGRKKRTTGGRVVGAMKTGLGGGGVGLGGGSVGLGGGSGAGLSGGGGVGLGGGGVGLIVGAATTGLGGRPLIVSTFAATTLTASNVSREVGTI